MAVGCRGPIEVLVVPTPRGLLVLRRGHVPQGAVARGLLVMGLHRGGHVSPGRILRSGSPHGHRVGVVAHGVRARATGSARRRGHRTVRVDWSTRAREVAGEIVVCRVVAAVHAVRGRAAVTVRGLDWGPDRRRERRHRVGRVTSVSRAVGRHAIQRWRSRTEAPVRS